MFPGIKQFYINVEREEWKFDTLCDLYETLTITQVTRYNLHSCTRLSFCFFNLQAVIFCNTKRKVDWLTEAMRRRDFTVSCLVTTARQTLNRVSYAALDANSTATWNSLSAT